MLDKAPNTSRRNFLKRSTGAALGGIAAPWLLNLSALANASAAGGGDYKAMVCIFLSGGNDQANTIVPYDSGNHELYRRFRPSFAYARERLAATKLLPQNSVRDAAGFAHEYALAPELAPLLPLFDAGRLGVVLNMGPLTEPTTKQAYLNNAVRLPPKLFSHNDQQSVWQSSLPEGAASGWGGRIGDLLLAENANPMFSCVNVAANTVFLSGRTAMQYLVSSKGPVAMNALKAPLFGSAACSTALRALISAPRAHLLEREYNRVNKRALEADELLTSALAAAPVLNTEFPGANDLARQLRMVARMIAVAPALGVRRQIFFVSMGGFDQHNDMLADHPPLLAQLGAAMAAFYAATAELNVAERVTAFTASEFGRTLGGNGKGSDHGWGSMQFVMGGAVRGGRYYGTAPILANDGPDDVGRGRLLPTTSVEQFAATMASWLGVSDSNLLDLLPNLANFDAGARKLAFV
ncbi:MAG: DUF1501 domain-containing protein [Pseudomonadota bacterium]